MSIRLTCPNGHALKVDESLAGRIGLCPACKARVQIPKLQGSGVSEDDILSLLSDPAEQNSQPAAGASPISSAEAGKSATPSSSGPAKFTPQPVPMPTKRCIKCHAEIAVAMHICPHCHTYVAKVSDVLRGR